MSKNEIDPWLHLVLENEHPDFKKTWKSKFANSSIRTNKKVHFTKRESECIYLIKKNLSNRIIGEKLAISPRTVDTYVSTIIRKLGCKRKKEIPQKLQQILDSNKK